MTEPKHSITIGRWTIISDTRSRLYTEVVLMVLWWAFGTYGVFCFFDNIFGK